MGHLRAFLLIGTTVLSSFFISHTSAFACAEKSNTTCEDCLRNVSCLWCVTTRACVKYPERAVLPPSSVCTLSQARWGRCWVNFQALILTIALIGGVIIISLALCCFCCCCRSKKKGPNREEIKMELENEKRKARQEERKAEMKMRHDEIRQKYGLTKENPYSKFDNQ